MQFTSHNNRVIDFSQPVQVYRNLNKKGVVYSVKQKGLVVGYTTDIQLIKPTFFVNQKAVERVRVNQVREVHAWIEGFVADVPFMGYNAQISYNPYKYNTFYNVKTLQPVNTADSVLFNVHGVFINQ